MSLLSALRRLFRPGRTPAAGQAHSSVGPSYELFVYIKIPASIAPLERARRFEDPLDAALKRAGVGEVSGGGSQLSGADDEGKRQIVFCGIDVDLTNADAGLALLHRELAHLQVPEGTVLEYERDGQEYEEAVARP